MGLLLILLTGLGLVARNGLGFPLWVWLKVAIWLAMGACVVLIKRAPGLRGPLFFLLPLLGGLAAWRLGGSAEMQVDVRVVAATNKDPLRAVQEGALREDLYYRLNVLSIALPALRDHMEDLPELLQTFLDEFNERHRRAVRGIDEGALALLRTEGVGESIGVVVTDHIMPELSGGELVKAVRAIRPEMPVIVITGLADAEDEYRELRVEFREKPVSPPELIELVRRATARKAA